MKFLCLSDIHSSNWVIELLDKINFDFNGIILTGDIAESGKYALTFIKLLIRKNKAIPIYYIPGNMDSFDAINEFKKYNFFIHNIKKNIKIETNLNFLNIVGYGYSSPTPFLTPGEKSENEIYEDMNKLNIDHNTILITHSPPKGILDNNYGSESIRKIVDKTKPLVHLFGHIHEVNGIKNNKNTTFVNIPPGNKGKAAILELSKNIISQKIDIHIKFVKLEELK